jgi:uncharacterized protein involved in exopolysaccharide biosynthesis
MITEQGYARLRGVLRRRRLPIVAVSLATLAIAVVVIGRLEPRFRAQAVVRALEAQPSKEYVAPSVGEPYGERLKTLRLELLSRPLLARIADEQGLVTAGKTRDQVIDGMRAHLEVKVEGEDTFLVTYEDRDPAHAQSVVNRLAALFMDEQVERREAMASATERSLSEEAKQLGPEVTRLEKEIRDFKLKHYGSLPEQQEQNLRLLDQTTMEINIQSTNLDMENQRRRELIAASMSPLRHQEDLLATSLHEARTQYTEEHPEVRRISAELDRTRKARIDEERQLRHTARLHSPELLSLESEIDRTTSMLSALRKRQDEVRSRVSATAKNGQDLAGLQADYDTVHGKHQAVVGRLREAELATRLEHGLAGLRYSLVEGAVLPTSPVHPNRPLLGLGAILLALALGLGVGFALDRADSRIYAPSELAALGRPLELLACVPDLDTVGAEGGAPLREARRHS